jgi:hypothetical protein
MSQERRLPWLFSTLRLDRRELQNMRSAGTHPAIPNAVLLSLVDVVCVVSCRVLRAVRADCEGNEGALNGGC